MDLREETEKLISYIGKDASSFKEQYKFLHEQFTSESERQQIDESLQRALAESKEQGEMDMEEVKLRVFLIENKEIIPISYIARNYFMKSKDWMYQRINGNKVNGKPAKFSPSEIKTFHLAIQDIGKKLGSIASSR